MSDTATVIAFPPSRNRELENEAHACQRAAERYKTTLTDADMLAMVRQIQEDRGVYLRRKSKMLSVWAVYWPSAETIVPVFYDRKRGQIASVLPRVALRVRDGNPGGAETEGLCREAMTARPDEGGGRPLPPPPSLTQGDEA